ESRPARAVSGWPWYRSSARTGCRAERESAFGVGRVRNQGWSEAHFSRGRGVVAYYQFVRAFREARSRTIACDDRENRNRSADEHERARMARSKFVASRGSGFHSRRVSRGDLHKRAGLDERRHGYRTVEEGPG